MMKYRFDFFCVIIVTSDLKKHRLGSLNAVMIIVKTFCPENVYSISGNGKMC